MTITDERLIQYGGVSVTYSKKEYIFKEGTMARFFYKLTEGNVRLFSTNDEGKQLTQGWFSSGESFGEPPLLLQQPYPSSSEAITCCTLIKLGRENLIRLFAEHPLESHTLMMTFAERIHKKANAARMMACKSAEEKILYFLKNNKPVSSNLARQLVQFTRNQIADATGLRVETVIRTVLKMSKQNKIEIINHKLYV